MTLSLAHTKFPTHLQNKHMESTKNQFLLWNLSEPLASNLKLTSSWIIFCILPAVREGELPSLPAITPVARKWEEQASCPHHTVLTELTSRFPSPRVHPAWAVLLQCLEARLQVEHGGQQKAIQPTSVLFFLWSPLESGVALFKGYMILSLRLKQH